MSEKNTVLNCTDATISCQFCGVAVPPNSDHECEERPTMPEMSDYPNIDMMLQGCTSGSTQEWPVLRREARELLAELSRLRTELASAKEELSLVKCGEPNHPDRAYAMKNWLKTFGFKIFCELKHGDVGFVLSLLQEGDISRGKAAEAIAELLVGGKPPLPALIGNTFGEDDFPSETVAKLRAELAAEREQTAGLAAALEVLCADREGNCNDIKWLRENGFEDLANVMALDYSAILAARDADQRRKGAAWALRQIGCTCPWAGRGTHDEECVLTLLAAIERGEVEVPDETI